MDDFFPTGPSPPSNNGMPVMGTALAQTATTTPARSPSFVPVVVRVITPTQVNMPRSLPRAPGAGMPSFIHLFIDLPRRHQNRRRHKSQSAHSTVHPAPCLTCAYYIIIYIYIPSRSRVVREQLGTKVHAAGACRPVQVGLGGCHGSGVLADELLHELGERAG